MATLIAMPTHTVLPGISPGTTPGTVLHTLGDGMILGTIPGMVGTDLITVTAGTVGAAGDGVGNTAILAGTTVGVQAGIMVGRLQHLHAHIVPEAVL